MMVVDIVKLDRAFVHYCESMDRSLRKNLKKCCIKREGSNVFYPGAWVTSNNPSINLKKLQAYLKEKFL